MAIAFTAGARKLGIWSAAASAVLGAAYAITLAAGLLSLPSPAQPIGDPLFSLLEILILLTLPVMVALMVALHAWASPDTKAFSLLALVFMGELAGLTCSVHFVILTVSHHPAFAGLSWLPLFVSFKWPSVAYALDILGWDVFFPLSVLSAAPVLRGSRFAETIRALLIVSGVLALGGLSGVVVGDMRLRNIGVVGYAGVFPVAALLMGVLFYRSTPREA